MDDYSKRRLAELHAAAPVKRDKAKPFAIIDLDAAAEAFTAMKCPKAMVYVWLVHQARKTGKRALPVPNGVLARHGVPSETKRRALRELEAGGVITVRWKACKTPVATLL
jgi:hypothetical protein